MVLIYYLAQVVSSTKLSRNDSLCSARKQHVTKCFSDRILAMREAIFFVREYAACSGGKTAIHIDSSVIRTSAASVDIAIGYEYQVGCQDLRLRHAERVIRNKKSTEISKGGRVPNANRFTSKCFYDSVVICFQ